MSAAVPVEALMIRAGASRPDRLAQLEEALAIFARRVPSSLGAYCGAGIRARLAGIEHLPLSGAKAPAEDALAATARHGAGRLRVWIEAAAIHDLIAMWSRDEGSARDVDALTPIERRMALRLCDRVFEPLAACIAPSGGPSPAGSILGMPDDDPADALGAVARLELIVRERTHGMWVVVPHEGLATGAAAPSGPDASAPSPGLSRRIAAARVTLSAVLGGGRVRLGDTFDWEPGTVVDLGIDRAQGIDLLWDGRPLFRGVAGRRRSGTMALRIVEDLRTQGDAQ